MAANPGWETKASIFSNTSAWRSLREGWQIDHPGSEDKGQWVLKKATDPLFSDHSSGGSNTFDIWSESLHNTCILCCCCAILPTSRYKWHTPSSNQTTHHCQSSCPPPQVANLEAPYCLPSRQISHTTLSLVHPWTIQSGRAFWLCFRFSWQLLL